MSLVRKIFQGFFIILFLFLIVSASVPSSEIIPFESYFFFDPLLAASSMIANRSIIPLMFLSIIILVLTTFLGRFFCGWICPMGTTIDMFDKVIIGKRELKFQNLKRMKIWKYFLLVLLLVLSIFSINLAGLFDPLSITTRSYSIVIYPAVSFLLKGALEFSATNISATGFSETLSFLTRYAIPQKNLTFNLQSLFLILLLLILLLDFIHRRFWCRNLCPLGALLSLFSLKRFLKPKIDENKCNECEICSKECRMNAIDGKTIDDVECIQCFNCTQRCKVDVVKVSFRKSKTESNVVPSRRAFLKSAAASILVIPFVRIDRSGNFIIRPPGALHKKTEEKFLDLCVKCGECVRICPTNGLQFTLLETGLGGIFSPILVPRIGECEYECNLCTQVCPTGALTELSVGKKKGERIGIAFFDKSKCIPWADQEECAVCEEFCPTPTKSIKLIKEIVIDKEGQEKKIKRPHVDKDLCIGCGICEKVCPVKGSAGIRVQRLQVNWFLNF